MGEDLLLKKQKSLSTEGLEYSFVSLPSSTIDIIHVNINLLWVMGNLGKTVEPRDIIINVQSAFKNNDFKFEDTFWKEHCASSLKELVDRHFEQNCCRFLVCVPKRGSSEDERKIWESLMGLKKFLNDFGHFNKTAINSAREILGNNSLIEINEAEFDKICVKFILQLGAVFKYKNR